MGRDPSTFPAGRSAQGSAQPRKWPSQGRPVEEGREEKTPAPSGLVRFPPSFLGGRCRHSPILQMWKLRHKEVNNLLKVTQYVRGRAQPSNWPKATRKWLSRESILRQYSRSWDLAATPQASFSLSKSLSEKQISPGKGGMRSLTPGPQCRSSTLLPGRPKPGRAQHPFPCSISAHPSLIASKSGHTAPAAGTCHPASVLSLKHCTPGCSRTNWGLSHRLPQRHLWSLEDGRGLAGFMVQLGSQPHLERHQSRGSPGSLRLTALVHQGPGPPSPSPSIPPSLLSLSPVLSTDQEAAGEGKIQALEEGCFLSQPA